MIRHTEVRTLTVSIDVPAPAVYAFAGDPRNLPRWAAGLARGIEPAGEHWHILTPEGPVVLRFTPKNDFGVMDHTVVLAGSEVFVPMRVVPNGTGSEVSITLFRQSEMDDASFDRDASLVQKDLNTLRDLLEG